MSQENPLPPLPEPQVRAQVLEENTRLQKENDWLRAYTGQSAKACVYCGLGADEQGKCERGFPGCARGDDQMLCREAAVGYERDQVLEVLRELVEAENARRLGVDTIGRLGRAWERARSLINPDQATG